MGGLHILEALFNQLSECGGYGKSFVTISATLGLYLIIDLYYKYLKACLIAYRLYVSGQSHKMRSFRKRYGQWAVISGSTDGIGFAMARELARDGHSILVIGRNEEKLAKTKAILQREPNVGEVETIRIDLSDSSLDNFERIRPQIDPEKRDIGILINNAGVGQSITTRFYNLDTKIIQNQINVNILALVYLTRMILPGMVSRGRGLVINLSSIFGSMSGHSSSFAGLYPATKTFVDCFSQQLNSEYADYPIDIINLKPGPVTTKLLSAASYHDKPTLIDPTPEVYARSALNACSTRIPDLCGFWAHGLSLAVIKILTKFGLMSGFYHFYIKHVSRNYLVSPSPSRRLQTSVTDEKKAC